MKHLFHPACPFSYPSVCRDAVNEMALHFLSKMKILVVRDIEREEVEFICRVCCMCTYTVVDMYVL